MNLLQIMQGGLSLGEKEYYLDNDSATVHIRESFKHIWRRCSPCAALLQKRPNVRWSRDGH